MSKVFIEESTLTSIGNSIREKTGMTDPIPTTEMATAIDSISSSGGGGLNVVSISAAYSTTTSIDLSNYVTDNQFILFFVYNGTPNIYAPFLSSTGIGQIYSSSLGNTTYKQLLENYSGSTPGAVAGINTLPTATLNNGIVTFTRDVGKNMVLVYGG